jgi:hypothetical protein
MIKILSIKPNKTKGYEVELQKDNDPIKNVWAPKQEYLDAWLEQTDQINEFPQYYHNRSWYEKTQELKKQLYKQTTLFPE